MRIITITALAFGLSGCLTAKLRTPVEDHYVQAQTIADSCRKVGLGEGMCTQEDFDAMALQAKCLDAIVKKKACDEAAEESSD